MSSRSPSRSEADPRGRQPSPNERESRIHHATQDQDGSAPHERARFRAWAWSKGDGLVELSRVEETREAYMRPGSFVWADIEEADAETLEELGACFELHPLVIEDILERDQRPKMELTDDVAHIVLFGLAYEGGVVEIEIDVVLGERFLLTTHPKGWDPLAGQHLRRGVEPFLQGGPDHLLWAISDPLVDDFFPVFDRLSDEIDELESAVLDKPSRWTVERLFQVRRDLLAIRHAVTPQREVFNQLTNRDLALIRPDKVIYFRDVYDHLIRLTDELDTHRELVSTALDAYLSTINNNLSEVMKRLTAATVILAGVGAIAGIFGMSEAGSAVRFQEPLFWLVTAVIVTLGAVGLFFFRRIGWL
jgi:magnesium transporter